MGDETLDFEMVEGVLHIIGEADASTSPLLFAAVTERAVSGVVVVDLAGITFIDSSGLHALSRLRRTLPGMRLVNPSPRVLRMLELTGLLGLLTEEPDAPGRGAAPTA